MLQKSASCQVVVSRPAGLHARPCVAIANTVRRFRSQVKICLGRQEVDASEVLQLLTLGAGEGAQLTLSADGPDAQEVLESLVRLFENDFGLPDSKG